MKLDGSIRIRSRFFNWLDRTIHLPKLSTDNLGVAEGL
jgi:hypothetical protein